jgi:hypothetical protein
VGQSFLQYLGLAQRWVESVRNVVWVLAHPLPVHPHFNVAPVAKVMCGIKSVTLFLDSTKRSRGTLQRAVFDLPYFDGRFSRYRKCYITTERWNPLATIADTDESLVLRLTAGPSLVNTYDSIQTSIRGEYAPSQVIAVQSQYQIRSGLAGSYRTSAEPLTPIELSGNPLGNAIELHIATLGSTGYEDANLPSTTNGREWYAVIKLDFHEEDLEDEAM